MSYATVAELRDYLDQLPSYGQQRITVTGAPAGGTYTLLYEGVASASIAYNASATTVQIALRGIAAIGSAGVKVTGAPGAYLAQFQGSLATDAGPLSLGTNALTGGTAPSVAIANATDSLLQSVLDRATAIIDLYLGSSFPPAVEDDEQIIYGDGTDYLELPSYIAGSIATVTAPAGYSVPDYTEQDGMLIVTRSDLLGYPYYRAETIAGRLYNPVGGWLLGVPYTVEATFGYETAPPDVVEACLEIAVDLWRFKDSGSIKAIGVEGAGMMTGKGLPATAKLILDRRLLDSTMPGVY